MLKNRAGITCFSVILFLLAFNINQPLNIWIQINNCEQLSNTFICDELPKLTLLAESTEEGDSVKSISGYMDGEEFECKGNICELQLDETDGNGIEITFKATYLGGVIGPKYWAVIRVLKTDTVESGYQVEVLSKQLRFSQFACCSIEWGSFPPNEFTPQIDNSITEITSNTPFYYLANQFILAGVVDTSQCPNGGSQNADYANYCGYQLVEEDVIAWQNQFDDEIINASNQAGIPPILLKSVIAIESQFWPADHDQTEFGFGHMTEESLTSILLWSPELFLKYYIKTFGQPAENNLIAYGLLSDYEIEEAQHYVLSQLKMSCIFCDYGLDLTKSKENIEILAYAIAANANQAGQVIRNVTAKRPGLISTYEDLWRFTLVNYHAGPMCLGDAIEATYVDGQRLNYSDVEENLSEGCATGRNYVTSIFPVE